MSQGDTGANEKFWKPTAIKVFELLESISEDDALTRYLVEDYINDKTKSDNEAQQANKVTNNNYPIWII